MEKSEFEALVSKKYYYIFRWGNDVIFEGLLNIIELQHKMHIETNTYGTITVEYGEENE